MFKKIGILFFVVHLVNGKVDWEPKVPAINQDYHKEVLDPVLCEEHLNYVKNDLLLRLQFIDAGMKFPGGILEGNTNHLGNFHQCLSINLQLENSEIQGKYCLVQVPLNQNLGFPQLSDFNIDGFNLEELQRKLNDFNKIRIGGAESPDTFDSTRVPADSAISSLVLRLALCIPKPCTTQEAITSFLFNVSAFGFEYHDEMCRLPDDKPWVAGDYIAVVLFSLVGFVSVVCTILDVVYKFVYKNETQPAVCTTFSMYTNGRRLLTFSSGPNALHCIDGIRALAMLWVLLGHTASTASLWANPLVAYAWLQKPEALWLTGSLITVDTFFTISGILLVYTTVGKLSGIKLLRNIHLFYLNRILRMFPVLATGVLLEATLFNQISDGPYWSGVVTQVEKCRTFWWSTLLYVQNYLGRDQICVNSTWYLAIDMQLHILSPLVLFWVLSGSKTLARSALALSLVLLLAAATTFNFIKNFPSTTLNPARSDELLDYFEQYYINTLTRASPFVVGMIIGYMLACTKGKQVRLSWPIVTLGWVCSIGLLSFVIYAAYPITLSTWDNQVLDNFYNSFIRPIWAAGLGWLIFACAHGYGGPINWFLSLSMFKLLARLSYAMYILHYGLMVVYYGSRTTPMFWSPENIFFTFLGHFGMTFMLSFAVVVIIDAPCSVLFKKLLGDGPKKPKKSAIEPDTIKQANKEV